MASRSCSEAGTCSSRANTVEMAGSVMRQNMRVPHPLPPWSCCWHPNTKLAGPRRCRCPGRTLSASTWIRPAVGSSACKQASGQLIFPFPIPFPFSSMLGKTVTPVVAIHEIYIPVGKISTMQVLSFGRLTLGFAGFRHSALELLPHPHTHTHGRNGPKCDAVEPLKPERKRTGRNVSEVAASLETGCCRQQEAPGFVFKPQNDLGDISALARTRRLLRILCKLAVSSHSRCLRSKSQGPTFCDAHRVPAFRPHGQPPAHRAAGKGSHPRVAVQGPISSQARLGLFFTVCFPASSFRNSLFTSGGSSR